jgi:drug/metabolite transporter (DMT)-like permease
MNPRTKAEFYLLSITFIWGSTFVLSKYLLGYITPLAYIGIRFSIAALLFSLIFFKQIRTLSKGAAIKGGILGALLFSGFAAQTIGLQYTTASKSAFITGMMVVFTPICQLIIERRPPKVGNIIGVVLVTIGLYLLTSPAGSEFNVGDALNLLCALTFGLYIVYLDVFSKGLDTAQLTFMQFVATAALGLVGAGLFEHVSVQLGSEPVLVLGYLIVFATIIALYIQVRFQKDTTPTRSAIIFSIEPVIAAVFAYLTLGEVLGTLGVIGGGLIVGGLLISELSPA